MTANPLIAAYKKPALYVALPSKGKWYDPKPKLSVDGELAVYAMSARDELITKTPDAYTISGIANNKREFKFFEPNIGNGTDYELQTINGATVRRYNKFVTTPSTLEFGSKLSKIQDVYSFIRGYWKYLESKGYALQFTGDNNAADFVNWTKSESFRMAHKNTGQHKGIYLGHPDFEGFKVIIWYASS